MFLLLIIFGIFWHVITLVWNIVVVLNIALVYSYQVV